MKNHLLLLGLVFMPAIGLSQEYEYVPFPDSGAIWSEIYYPSMSSEEKPQYERFAINGEDTIIGDKSYKKLFLFYDTIFNKNESKYIGGIREDEHKRIYFKGDTVVHELKPMNEFYGYDEIILFDFSVKVGDTLKNINCYPEDDRLIIDKIDTIKVGSTLRKRFHFESIWWVKWIEGIGNVKGLLFTSGDLPTNGMNNNLICFKQNNEILYFNESYSSCIPLITDLDRKKNEPTKICIFPNPANNEMNFDFGRNIIDKIKLFDSSGTLIDELMVSRELPNRYNVTTEKYKPGIYFYKATDIKGIVYTGKFVVQ